MLIKRIAGGAALLLSVVGSAAAAEADPRAIYLAGQRAASSEARRSMFASGIAAARARLQHSPDDPEGLLWLAANLGAEALERGRLAALKVLPEMERLLLRLEERAPLFDHAAAARTLGRLYHKAPALISIGSMKKARLYWGRALERAGDYPPNLVLAADFLHDDGDEARARQLAARYLQAPISEREHPEAGQWRQIAQRLAGSGR